jgi:hypothetical protein
MPQLTALFSNASDVLVITLGVRRTDGQHVTDAQKDAAMDAAKSVLQIIGADVEANSTAILTNAELNEGDSIRVTTGVETQVITANANSSNGDPLADIDAGLDDVPECENETGNDV